MGLYMRRQNSRPKDNTNFRRGERGVSERLKITLSGSQDDNLEEAPREFSLRS